MNNLSNVDLSIKFEKNIDQMLNILDDLKWIYQDKKGNWKLTELGRKNGGIDGDLTVKWQDSILENNIFLQAIKNHGTEKKLKYDDNSKKYEFKSSIRKPTEQEIKKFKKWEEKRNRKNYFNYKNIRTYTLTSIFWGGYVLLQTIIYFIIISFDTYFQSSFYIIITDIFIFIIGMILSIIVWKSANEHNKNNPTSFWGNVTKAFIAICLITNLVYIVSGNSYSDRMDIIKLEKLEKRILEDTEKLTKKINKTISQFTELFK